MDWTKIGAVLILGGYILLEPDLLPIVGWDDGVAGFLLAYFFTKD